MVVTALLLLLDKEANLGTMERDTYSGKPFSVAEDGIQLVATNPRGFSDPRTGPPWSGYHRDVLVRGLTPWIRRSG